MTFCDDSTKYRVACGVDGMTADLSVTGLEPHFSKIKARWPVMALLIEALEKGRDEELTREALGLTQSQFLEIVDWIRALEGVEVKAAIGGNTALQMMTHHYLLQDLAGPLAGVEESKFDFLATASTRVIQEVPDHVPRGPLQFAMHLVDSGAMSLIIPYRGKRAILSSGGDPPSRTLSTRMRRYLSPPQMRRQIERTNPDLLALVGTHVTFGAATDQDFEMLIQMIELFQSSGAKVLMDLGGLGSWDEHRLEKYFQVCAKVDILCMNEDELAFWYEYQTGEAPSAREMPQCLAMMKAMVRKGQVLLVHSPTFQLAWGLKDEDKAKEALRFASRAACYRGYHGRFPTACQVMRSRFVRHNVTGLGHLPKGFVGVPAYVLKGRNTVGLGDVWTQAFIQACLAMRVF